MSNTFPWLTVLGVLPLVGALLVTLLPKAQPVLAKQVALGTSLLVLVGAVIMCAEFDPKGGRFQFAQSHDWIKAFGVQYSVGVDGIALVLIALIAVLVPVVLLASWDDVEQVEVAQDAPAGSTKSVKSFFALLLVLETMMIGVFAATDVFLFYVFF